MHFRAGWQAACSVSAFTICRSRCCRGRKSPVNFPTVGIWPDIFITAYASRNVSWSSSLTNAISWTFPPLTLLAAPYADSARSSRALWKRPKLLDQLLPLAHSRPLYSHKRVYIEVTCGCRGGTCRLRGICRPRSSACKSVYV